MSKNVLLHDHKSRMIILAKKLDWKKLFLSPNCFLQPFDLSIKYFLGKSKLISTPFTVFKEEVIISFLTFKQNTKFNFQVKYVRARGYIFGE
jgi:hypothetical protein